MKEKKYIFLKIFIALILLLIIGRCTQKGFILNVKAESPSLYFHVPNSDTLKNYGSNKLFSNFAYTNTTNNSVLVENISLSSIQYYNTLTRVEYLNISDFSVLQNGLSFSSPIGSNYNISKYSGNVEQFLFIDKFQYGPTIGNSIGDESDYLKYFKLQKGHTYEVLFEIKKDDSTYIRKNLQTDDIIFNIKFLRTNTNYDYIFNEDCIDITFKNFIIYDDIKGNEKNYSYLLARFKLKDEVPNNITNYSYYNNNSYFYLGNVSFSTNFVNNVDRKSFFQKQITSISDEVPHIKINKVSLLEDGHFSFTPSTSVNQDLDNVSLNDMIIFGNLEECSLTDISCHFNNLNTLIKNLFVRIGNGINSIINNITSLFIPNFEQFGETITTNNTILTEKLGFIMYPFNLFLDICNRFLNINIIQPEDVVINIEEVRDPFFNQVLISSGAWHLGSIIQQEPIHSLYIIYRAFISVYICYLFICLCYDAFTSFINGDGGRVSTWTNEIIKDYGYVDDDNPLRRR